MGSLDDSEVSSGIIPSEVFPLLHKLAGKWPDVLDALDVTWRPLKGAMTNHIYECQWPGGSGRVGEQQRKALVRIYGDSVDILFKREDEVRIFEFVSRKGQGPRLLGRFPNGRVEEFIHARTLTAADLRDPGISARIAAKMWEFHRLDLPESHEPKLWERLRDWLQKAEKLCSPQSMQEFHMKRLESEIREAERTIPEPGDVIGFCHNDLQYGNIMHNDATDALTIIDYEYASYNPVAFDIANHFCEMAADYHTESPHRLDYAKYPGKYFSPYEDERRRFIEAYLDSSGSKASRGDVDTLLLRVDLYELASHLHWGLWGIISVPISDIDFDFLEYARQRFQRYDERKRELWPRTMKKYPLESVSYILRSK
ncbi:hypothetical protein SELMODRAFT_103062 [Selaginella moellendorffii]|uniref:Choline kinase N-terminal domain-containing protein n=1 Tax=Selaginella moellendorffii TaxID=88036 RepID=D8RW81_SELML|nr:hypothetical protein SELMODRAFT_103062 [Selaginella moellendorffii]